MTGQIFITVDFIYCLVLGRFQGNFGRKRSRCKKTLTYRHLFYDFQEKTLGCLFYSSFPTQILCFFTQNLTIWIRYAFNEGFVLGYVTWIHDNNLHEWLYNHRDEDGRDVINSRVHWKLRIASLLVRYVEYLHPFPIFFLVFLTKLCLFPFLFLSTLISSFSYVSGLL